MDVLEICVSSDEAEIAAPIYIKFNYGSPSEVIFNGIAVGWDKVQGADRYIVYISTKKKSGYEKVATTTGTGTDITKYKNSKLQKGKTYYIKVAAQKKAGKKYYTGTPDNYYSFGFK